MTARIRARRAEKRARIVAGADWSAIVRRAGDGESLTLFGRVVVGVAVVAVAAAGCGLLAMVAAGVEVATK